MADNLVDHEWVIKRMSLNSRETLHSWVHRRQIPHVRLSPRVVRFDPGEIEKWIEARRVPQTP